MPKIIQISTSMVAIPMQNPLDRTIQMQVAHSIFGVDADGQVWEFVSNLKKWNPLPMDFVINQESPSALA